jgi:hypothetical protein
MNRKGIKIMSHTRNIYEERDGAASNSYTLHAITAMSCKAKDHPPVSQLRAMFLGNITFRRAKSGMRTTCYLHIFSSAIVKGISNGCGYDVQSAAFVEAMEKWRRSGEERISDALYDGLLAAVNSCHNDGRSWQAALETHADIFAAQIGG